MSYHRGTRLAIELFIAGFMMACAPFAASPPESAGAAATAPSHATGDASAPATDAGFDRGFAPPPPPDAGTTASVPSSTPSPAPTPSASAPAGSSPTSPTLPAPQQPSTPGATPNTISSATLSITAVGDVQLGRAWPESAADLPPDGPHTLLARVADLLSVGDFTFGNLETALADHGDSYKCGRHAKACYAFRAPSAYAQVLADSGFAVVSSANNHAGDFGAPGRAATRAALDAAHIAYAGVQGEVASFERQGLRIALIAFAFGDGMNRVQDVDKARELVTAARRDHDIVIVSMHVGAEGTAATHVTRAREVFMGEDRGNPYALAHAVVDAGADLVLGHGPHVLRGMELYHDRLIAYSLGNFCAWRSFSLSGALSVSGVLQVTLARDGTLAAARLLPVVLEDAGIPAPDPQARAIKAVRELSLADFGKSVLDERGTYSRAALASQTN